MGIAGGRSNVAVPQKLLNRNNVDSRAHETSRERMSQVVDSYVWDLCQPYRLHEPHFRISKPFVLFPGAWKDKLAFTYLPKAGQQLEDYVVHRDAAVTFVSLAVQDGDLPIRKVEVFPSKSVNFAFAHPGI